MSAQMDQLTAVLISNAKTEAAEEGVRFYVTKSGQVTKERPERDNMEAECYPGGRVIWWGGISRA